MARFGKLGLIFGLLFGALFGVLFAPRAGKELRQKIKNDRQKGRLGIAPLSDDLKDVGLEIASVAKDIYESEEVQDIVEKGRRGVKRLSDNLVDEITDFNRYRIRPLKEEAKRTVDHGVDFVKDRISSGEKVFHGAKKEFKALRRKAKKSVKIGKKAAAEIKGVMKKKAGR
ncbi:MAG: YtxH domain-containing protein [Patescibacteria group bacterium]